MENAGTACTCPGVRSLDGSACISACPANSANFGGQCQCAEDFALSADKTTCEHTGAPDSTNSDENARKRRIAAEIAVFSCIGALEVVFAVLLGCWQCGLRRHQTALDERERSLKRKSRSIAPLASPASRSADGRPPPGPSFASRGSSGQGSVKSLSLRRNSTSISDGTLGSFLCDGALGSASETVFRVDSQKLGPAAGEGRKRRKIRRELSSEEFGKFGLHPVRLDAGD